ncbi:MAG: hypothetical protein KBG21_01375 [Ignavibacteria bacterium]|nr:hypothetical protein [Ignavibacteria bacterium]
MKQYSNKIFIACNYNNKKIKTQFDTLKKKIERKFPYNCIIIDKEKIHEAKDLWGKIKSEIKSSGICFFDVTGFRPNVVLELGFALGITNSKEKKLFLTFHNRANGGSKPEWNLSDVTGLIRIPYNSSKQLEQHCLNQIKKLPFYDKIQYFNSLCKGKAGSYKKVGNMILLTLRDQGPKTYKQLEILSSKSYCRVDTLISMLKKSKLISKARGPNGRISLIA